MKFDENGLKLLVIDTETGGFDPEAFSILSIGAVIWKSCKIINSKEILIAEPEIKYEEEALSVNQIDIEHIKEVGLDPLSAIIELEHFIDTYFEPGERILLSGHNVWFDIRFIERLYKIVRKNFRKKFSYRLLDTSSILIFLFESGVIKLSKPSLDNAIKYFNIPKPKKRHSALDDALATALLLSHLFTIRLS